MSAPESGERPSSRIEHVITRDIRAYVSRDWDAARIAKDQYWAARIRRLGPGEGLRIADELRRQVLAQQPDWPSAAERSEDLAAHARLAERLRRASHPGSS
jgi:hypothetical protein